MFLYLSLLACNPDIGMDAVSIRPIYGWQDGCTQVTFGGHGFGDDVVATMGGQPVTGIVRPTSAPDRGYTFSGLAPAASSAGLADVVVTSGGVSASIPGTGRYTYVACPGAGYVDEVSPGGGAGVGATVELSGCGLDATSMRARLVDAAGESFGSATLSSRCGRGRVSFTVPDVADGDYYLQLVDLDGNLLSGGICPPPDMADTAAPACTDMPFHVGVSR